MQIWGVTMVRDEADIIELTLRHLIAQGVDRLLVADNLSSDGTRELLEKLASDLPLTVVDDLDPAYRQSEKMTSLANQAAVGGATWIVPFDADEFWSGVGCSLREVIEMAESPVLAARQLDHYPRPTRLTGTAPERLPWWLEAELPKVAFRWQPGAIVGSGNHTVSGFDELPYPAPLRIDHYPHRTWQQFRRKYVQGAAALQAANASQRMGTHWRKIGNRPTWAIRLAWWQCRMKLGLRRD